MSGQEACSLLPSVPLHQGRDVADDPTVTFKNSLLNLIWIVAASWSGEASPSFTFAESILSSSLIPPPGCSGRVARSLVARTRGFRPLDLGCYASSSNGCTKASACLFDESRRYNNPPGPHVCCVGVCVMMINIFVLEASRVVACFHQCVSLCVHACDRTCLLPAAQSWISLFVCFHPPVTGRIVVYTFGILNLVSWRSRIVFLLLREVFDLIRSHLISSF